MANANCSTFFICLKRELVPKLDKLLDLNSI
jgi:hypothetical protein